MSDLITVKVSPFNAESAPEQLEPDLTPSAGFYVRSNFAKPQLDASGHRVVVGGAVERETALGLGEIMTLGARTIVTTMECAGNNRMSLAPLPSGEPWLGGAVSTGRWTGAPLRAVLERAGGLRDGAVEVLVVGADSGKPKDFDQHIPFARSLPREKALHEDTLLAWEMNGEPLPPDHGAPLRLVVPGWYGMAGVKWIERIEALTEPFTGYYQTRRYIYDRGDGNTPEPVTKMLVKAIVTSPNDGDTVPVGQTTVRGRTWSGSGEVARVEVALDGGETWSEARLGPSVGPYGWRTWEWDWNAADPGRHALRARATDAAGNTQPPIARWNKYGYGSNGVQITVVDTR